VQDVKVADGTHRSICLRSAQCATQPRRGQCGIAKIPDTPVLFDEMVTLDAFQMQDAESHLAGEDDELARRFGWFPRRSTLEGVRESIARWREEWTTGPTRAFAVRIAAGGELVGGCELRMKGDGTASMSYWTFAAYRRRGFAVRAVRLASSYAFGTYGLTQIELEIEPDNTASRGVARRAGFTEAGTTMASPGPGAEPRTMLRYILATSLCSSRSVGLEE
jgi:RimJ/RimL family protein N-acetyltransferase